MLGPFATASRRTP